MTDSELDPTLEWIAREARRPVAIGADARERLLAAIRQEPVPSPSSGAWSPMFNRRAVVMSPARFAALAAGLVGIGILSGVYASRAGQSTGQSTEVAVASTSQRPASSDTMLTFVIVAPS